MQRYTANGNGEPDDHGIYYRVSEVDAQQVESAAKIAELEKLLIEARALAEWKPITPESLPKVGDEVLSEPVRSVFYEEGARSVYSPLRSDDLRPYKGWINSPSTPFTHYRPVNPPTPNSNPIGKDNSMPKPSVGRIVHYQSYGTPNGEYTPQPRAAVITEVDEDTGRDSEDGVPCVGLCVLNPTGQFFNLGVPYSAKPKPGYWSWPPRVE